MSGDYGGYRALIEEARELQKKDREEPLVACPIDGALLDLNPRTGELNCPMGNFRTKGRYRNQPN